MSTHEDFSRKLESRGPSDRSFGLVMAVFFLLAALWPLRHGGNFRLWAGLVAAAFLLPALVFPRVLHPANILWMKLGLLLSKVVNPIIVALLFYLVITPIGLLMRLLGKDPLRLKYDSAASSYWIDRQPPGPAPESMSQQF